MDKLRIYDQLLRFPLFMGMSHDDLSLVAGHTKMDFRSYAPNEVIVREGDRCDHLMLLDSGTVKTQGWADDRSYQVTEVFGEGYMLQPMHLFGTSTRYSLTITASTTCQLIIIAKEEVMALMDKLLIFKLNLLNTLAAQAQKSQRRPWHPAPRTIEEQIVGFLEAHCQRPAGEKQYKIKMTDLAIHVHHSRLQVSHALRRMEQQGLIRLSRGTIDVPAMEKLLMSA